ncbi:hypothetical protein GCM10022225_43330 [Plantactinospora mayteni]|uniref:Uncharacterized protein n=1 Tax=Plantactinospora mayteni TaxID=566021 RepID=A0ABQ4ES05_9ACTN|nr:hypothetical protein [Plantactinospora mayteni]GIG97457.1 hypothetical protein Pma05_40300 [Plantactinospora mayteni]
MSVRRGATWLGTVCVLVGTTVSLAAAPAVAEDESVRVRVPKSISAGGSPGSVTVNVSMDDGDCVNVRTALGVHLPGLTADRVEMQVDVDGDWRRVSVSDAANGLVVGERTAPEKPELCEKKSVSSRYRVILAEGVPGGRVTLVAEAYAAGGRLLGRDSDSARVTGRTGDAADSSERIPELVTPSATAQATEVPGAEATQDGAVALPTKPAAADSSGGSLGLGGLVMVVGVVMVGIGIALMVLLIRRSRAEGGRAAGAPSAGADPTARIVLLGAEPTTRIAPTPRIAPTGADPTARITPVGTVFGSGADPTARITPVGPVFRSGVQTPGVGPVGSVGPLPGSGPVGAAGRAPDGRPGGVPPVVGDQTLILPAAGVTPPRPAGTTPPRQPGPVPPHGVPPHGATPHGVPPHGATPHGVTPYGVPPARAGSVAPGDVPARPGAAPPRPDGSVPPEQPPAGGPDATLILPPARRPPQ